MSMDNIYTINLGKVLLSQRQHRAVRAINMIREYVKRHTGNDHVKIDSELAETIWARGVRSPPRKITVEIIEDDTTDAVIVMNYDGELTSSVEVSEPDPTKPERAEYETPQIESDQTESTDTVKETTASKTEDTPPAQEDTPHTKSDQTESTDTVKETTTSKTEDTPPAQEDKK